MTARPFSLHNCYDTQKTVSLDLRTLHSGSGYCRRLVATGGLPVVRQNKNVLITQNGADWINVAQALILLKGKRGGSANMVMNLLVP